MVRHYVVMFVNMSNNNIYRRNVSVAPEENDSMFDSLVEAARLGSKIAEQEGSLLGGVEYEGTSYKEECKHYRVVYALNLLDSKRRTEMIEVNMLKDTPPNRFY